MKRSISMLAAVLALTLSASAWATKPGNGNPTPPPFEQGGGGAGGAGGAGGHGGSGGDAAAAAGAAAQAGAVAGAAAGALSGSVSNAQAGDSKATAAGGDAKSGSYSAGGSAAGGNGGGLNDNSSMYVLPAPVWSSVPQAAGCIVTNSTSGAFGWNLISASRTVQGSDPVCVGVILAKSAYDHCHFESEQLITARVYATIFPGAPALPTVPGLRNLSAAECAALKR